jgi:hypothetical protein
MRSADTGHDRTGTPDRTTGHPYRGVSGPSGCRAGQTGQMSCPSGLSGSLRSTCAHAWHS